MYDGEYMIFMCTIEHTHRFTNIVYLLKLAAKYLYETYPSPLQHLLHRFVHR